MPLTDDIPSPLWGSARCLLGFIVYFLTVGSLMIVGHASDGQLSVNARFRAYMQQIAARVPEEVDQAIEAFSDENGCTKSEAVRALLKRGVEYDSLQRENERLRSEKRTILHQREENTELVEYVQEERELRQRREERRDAPAWTRAKWWLLGRDRDDGKG